MLQSLNDMSLRYCLTLFEQLIDLHRKRAGCGVGKKRLNRSLWADEHALKIVAQPLC
jgi:hypothetical protein